MHDSNDARRALWRLLCGLHPAGIYLIHFASKQRQFTVAVADLRHCRELGKLLLYH